MSNTNLIETKLSVTTKILATEDGENTFSITKEVEGIEGEHAYFILLYPTRTEENWYVEDSTNEKILKHISDLGLSSYTIINLFSQVTKSRLSLSGLSVDEENMSFIKTNIFSKLSDDSKMIIAWGRTQENSLVVCQSKQRILELWQNEQPSRPLYQLTTNGLTNDNIGVHPLYLGIRHNNSCWKLVDYPYKRVLKELETQMKAKEPKKKEKEDERKKTKDILATKKTKGKKMQ